MFSQKRGFSRWDALAFARSVSCIRAKREKARRTKLNWSSTKEGDHPYGDIAH